MGIISIEKADHLYWLGRYAERVLTTLREFFEVYDAMIDREDANVPYGGYCERLSIPNIYTSDRDFVKRYLFDEKNPDSLIANMNRAYDNAVVLRDELSSMVLSYIQLALDVIKSSEQTDSPLFHLQPVIDDIFAFWGCADDFVVDEECRNIMKSGKYVERLDLYLRLEHPRAELEKELSKLTNRLSKIKIPVNQKKLKRVQEILGEEDWRRHYFEALDCLRGIVEVY